MQSLLRRAPSHRQTFRQYAPWKVSDACDDVQLNLSGLEHGFALTESMQGRVPRFRNGIQSRLPTAQKAAPLKVPDAVLSGCPWGVGNPPLTFRLGDCRKGRTDWRGLALSPLSTTREMSLPRYLPVLYFSIERRCVQISASLDKGDCFNSDLFRISKWVGQRGTGMIERIYGHIPRTIRRVR